MHTKIFSMLTQRVGQSAQMRRKILAALLGALGTFSLVNLGLSSPITGSAWPHVNLPRDAQSFELGQQLDVNGMPMRIMGFVSQQSLTESRHWFENQLGSQQVKDTRGIQTILGTAHGDHYITVQLEPVDAWQPDSGTRGLITIMDRRESLRLRQHTARIHQQWLQRLPSGTQLLQHMSANDHGRVSQYLVATNNAPEQLNAEQLTRSLQELGYQLEREVFANGNGSQILPPPLSGGRTLLFRGPAREAMALIATDPQGRSSIVLNTVVQVETYP